MPSPVELLISVDADAYWCGRETARFAATCGFELRVQEELSIVASELVSNVRKYAGTGTFCVRSLQGVRSGLEIIVQDQGPGIDDPAWAAQDGNTTGMRAFAETNEPGRRRLSSGTGLGAVQRLTDEATFDTTDDGGTTVTVRRWLTPATRK